MKKDFTHLHLHSVYSLLDGAIRIKDLVREVKRMGMSSVAVTDHGNMFGAIDFYEEAKKQGVKPIIGCEFYVAPASRFEKRSLDNLADGNAYHLVLLAKNATGYKNLIKMSSRAYTEGFYRKPRIDYELLSQHSEGVIGLTACLGGEVNRKLYQGKYKAAEDLAGRLNEMLGQGNFFLELQDHGIPEQRQVAKGAIELSKKNNIPLVLTNDAHFLRREDQKAQDIMLRIQMNKKITDPMDFSFNEEFYVKSPEEMSTLYPENPEAFLNTLKISEMVDLEMDFGNPLLPNFKIPDGMTLAKYLDNLSFEGLKRKFEGSVPDIYLKRLSYELNVIHSMKYDGYFLIVQDFIQYAKNNAIPVGPGRGSAAGSLVAYSLGITNLDPIRYDLLFERFLNPDRNEMPDIDIDFCRDRREEVIQYVVNTYGEDHVSQIITFGTLSAKAVIKDVARVLGYSFAEVNALSKHLPDTPGISLEDAIKNAPEAKDFFEADEKGKLLWQVSKTLEGIPRNSGKHAAGVVISPEPMENLIPLAKDSKTGSVISQFEKGPLEKVGLVKMDFLGLKNLTIIQSAIDEIERRHGKKIDLDSLPLNDPKPYTLLCKGYTKGIFQVENIGITKLLIKARPEKFEDIVACIALYRPGPIESGMMDDYLSRKSGEVKVTYPHPDLEEVLSDTFGTIIYQEQVMRISQVIGGFSMAEADTLRKAMGKKKMDVMEKIKSKFIEGAQKKGHAKKWSDDLFEIMAKFAGYGFNKSHAAAYGLITYQTAWLKAHYPVEFMKASLDADIDNTEKLIGFIHTCKNMDISVLPPDINESDGRFTVISDSKIRYGLLGIKGIGRGPVEKIINSRNEGQYIDIFDFTSRLDSKNLNRKVFEALLYSGAFDSLGLSRATIFSKIDSILTYGQKLAQDRSIGQESLFSVGDDKKEASPVELMQVEEWPEEKKLFLEKSTLGLYLSSHPLNEFVNLLPHTKITPLSDIDDGVNAERKIILIAVIEEVKVINTRRGTTYYNLTISDLSGRKELRVYGNLVQKTSSLLQENQRIIIQTKVTVHRDSDPPSILLTALNIDPIEKLNDFVSKSLHIFFQLSSLQNIDTLIPKLKQKFREYSGDCPVFLHYKNEVGMQVLQVHPSYYTSYKKELTEAIVELVENASHVGWRIANKLHMANSEIISIDNKLKNLEAKL